MNDGYLKHRVTIAGDSLLMHNGQTADPFNKFSKAMKAITSDKNLKKTEDGNEQLMRLEYEAGLYLDTKARVVLPSRVLEAHLCVAAKKTKDGKTALSSLFVDCDGVLEYEGGPLTVAELLDSDAHRLTVGVRVQQARIMRTRPLFTDWSATFDVSVLTESVNSEQLKRWIIAGGAAVGIGDYRPRYGRYTLEKFEVVKATATTKKPAAVAVAA